MHVIRQELKRYRVIVRRVDTYEAAVEVDAASEGDASATARQQALDVPGLVWHKLGSAVAQASTTELSQGYEDVLMRLLKLWPAYAEVAAAEGWGLFNVDLAGVPVELQRDDEMAVFASDDEALEFVRRGTGTHHNLAVRILYLQGF